MRVAVMGAGGLGGCFGGLLAHAGEDVSLIARGSNLDAIRANGLTVKRIPSIFTVYVKDVWLMLQVPRVF